MKRTLRSQVDEVRGSDEQATAGDHHAVQRNAVVLGEGDANDEQREARQRKKQRQRPVMMAIATDQTDQCQRAGEHHKTAFEGVIGQETEANEGQYGQNKGQCRTVNGAEEGCRCADPVSQGPQTVVVLLGSFHRIGDRSGAQGVEGDPLSACYIITLRTQVQPPDRSGPAKDQLLRQFWQRPCTSSVWA
jgi:hypothetical protein